ncbi:hypothetical protein E2C01_037563 [Portunus trituberculatus]|uniref:Uncharacterized protein n=1 Tax=Portunus trituberculatus TaxID=210409 RepID=A0A5B7FF99_PORTR|nr:hypothetical protein [Portunus trituberculatus]
MVGVYRCMTSVSKPNSGGRGPVVCSPSSRTSPDGALRTAKELHLRISFSVQVTFGPRVEQGTGGGSR